MSELMLLRFFCTTPSTFLWGSCESWVQMLGRSSRLMRLMAKEILPSLFPLLMFSGHQGCDVMCHFLRYFAGLLETIWQLWETIRLVSKTILPGVG